MNGVVAWLVIARDGFRAVFIDEAQALNYAARCHGTVHALVREDGGA